MKLLKHHRIRISDRLAILAAVLLLISSVAANNSSQNNFSTDQRSRPALQIKSVDSDNADEAVEHQHRRLNLGWLLFRLMKCPG